MSDNKRIAKNTLYLYLRSLIVLVISLYTSRLLLSTLGVVDYGIYNVVGGVVAMMSFLNTSMAATYQRYFNFESGKKNITALSNLFRSSLTVQFIYALLILLLAETAGLYYVNNYLILPPERLVAAKIVYQISLLSFVISMFQVPFSALIISHERMSIFALVSIIDAFLKLGLIILLKFIPIDNLIVYALFMLSVTIFNITVYISICKKNFSECQVSFSYDKSSLKSLLSFGGFGMISTLSNTLKSQGINILLNLFFGPIVNAARGIAYQVLTAVEQFVTSFQTAFRPRLTKLYAEGNLTAMYSLYFSATKLSFYIMWCFALPLIIETSFILQLWLGDNIPNHAVSFTQLVLMTALVSTYANPTSCIAYATGNIKKFTIWVSGLNLLIVPIAYVFLKLGAQPETAMLVSLIVSICVQIVRLIILKTLVIFSFKNYFRKVVVPTITVAVISYLLVTIIQNTLYDTVFLHLLCCAISVLCVMMSVFVFGLSVSEQTMVKDYIAKFISRKK